MNKKIYFVLFTTVFLFFIFFASSVSALTPENCARNNECLCGERDGAIWTQRHFTAAQCCDSNFIYRGKTRAEWRAHVEGPVQEFINAMQGHNCSPDKGDPSMAPLLAAAWGDFESEGLSCVCDPETRPICQTFKQFVKPGPPYPGQGNGGACGHGGTEPIGGNGSLIHDPERFFSPEGISTFRIIKTAGKEFFFELPVFGEINSFTDILGAVGKFMFNLAIPIAVILIIFSGIKMLTSAGNPTRIASAKKTLFYTLVGFAIVLIARGFFTLVKSILEIGG